MQDYEKTFDPSRYADRPDKQAPKAVKNTEQEEQANRPDAPLYLDRTEKIMGYKLQVYSTTSIDDATNRKEYLRSVLDSLQIDMVFDAPYYKLRLGNFLERKDAEIFKSELQDKGVNDAWIVRDNVYMTRKEKIQ